MDKETNIKKIKYSRSIFVNVAILPIVYLVILIFLFSFLIKSGLSKYSDQRKLIKESQALENVLKQKTTYLNENQVTIMANSGMLAVALPEKNPALIIMSQIKLLQGFIPVTISNMRFSSPGQVSPTRNSLGITFSVDGDMEGITSLIDKILNILPLITINKIDISGTGGAYTADIKVTSYWEKLPEKIPAVTDPIKEMSKDSLTLITKLQGMEKPEFQTFSPQPPSTRTNPF